MKHWTTTARHRKGLLSPTALASLGLAGALTLFASAQDFSLTGSFTSGGGTSAGGAFSLSGTMGLPAGGRSSGGAFTMEGGFESMLVALQHADFPKLDVTRVGSDHKLSWTADATAFVLESTASLTPPILWAPVAGTATDADNVRSMTLPLPAGPRFYRLRKP